MTMQNPFKSQKQNSHAELPHRIIQGMQRHKIDDSIGSHRLKKSYFMIKPEGFCNPEQGQLQIWMEHSTLISLNLRILEISKKSFNIILRT